MRTDIGELIEWGYGLRREAERVRDVYQSLQKTVIDAHDTVAIRTAERDDSPRTVQALPRLDLLENDSATQRLLGSIKKARQNDARLSSAVQLADETEARLAEILPLAKLSQKRWRMSIARKRRRRAAEQSVDALRELHEWARSEKIADYLSRSQILDEITSEEQAGAWRDFLERPEPYLNLLSRYTGLRLASPRLVSDTDVRTVADVVTVLPMLQAGIESATTTVRETFEAIRERMVDRALSEMPLTRLKDVTDNRLRLGALERAGYKTVKDVQRVPVGRLQSYPGVGYQTAMQVVAAARQLAQAVRDDLKFRIDLDPANWLATKLLTHLYLLDRLGVAKVGAKRDIAKSLRSFQALIGARPPLGSRVAFIGKAQGEPLDVNELENWSRELRSSGITDQLAAIRELLDGRLPPADTVWKDFERKSPEYYTLLGTIVGIDFGKDAEAGFLPEEIVERVHSQPLDDSLTQVSLRGYQSFGARFALVQKRVIIGDEMGLGKTIQAIAVLGHLEAVGAKGHLLVICPASVIVNWTREVVQRSALRVHRLHGPEKEYALRRWRAGGGVAVTTFETLRSLGLRDLSYALVVVDEAHYLKNSKTQRSRNVVAVLRQSDRALFLTGTPLENRLEEFQTLVEYLQPELLRKQSRSGYVSPETFRTWVAPAYLRRNQEDVLAELPELVITDEWEEFSSADRRAYRKAVMDGNFMAMRRAAFYHPDQSSKLARLKEIVNEATDNGRKTIVFSYFRDVLETVGSALSGRVVGPLTGSVSATKRQFLVDEFTNGPGNAVLLSQIQAGGVGLNMQAGSVVIICEPQVKPTLETQAIARAYRMGQVRGVQVHRLLTSEGVDQRMVEILDSKQRIFDQYVRKSDLADASPEAVDISESELARLIVDEEQQRIASEMAERISTAGEVHV